MVQRAIEGLQPERVWGLFGEISSIPRGSGNEAAVREAMARRAGARGCSVRTDATGNLCITVPATRGYERAPGVVLQGHLDMVCEKDPGVAFDFTSEGIRLVRDGEWIRADGTTLGADNGIGVAVAMALAGCRDVRHGPLEILLTVDEETGLTGATGIDPDLVRGRLLINLDSEHTGTVCIGCAGGGGVDLRLPVATCRPEPGLRGYELQVAGLQGGHSGLNIHENRANAITWLVFALQHLAGAGARVEAISGGDKHNAIPRAARALIGLPDGAAEQARAGLQDCASRLRAEFPDETGARLTLQPRTSPGPVLELAAQERIVDVLSALPSGVTAMSRTVPGLVETSANLATVIGTTGAVMAHVSTRSSVSRALERLTDQILAIGRLGGAIATVARPYPGWPPDPASPLLHLVETVHTDLFGQPPLREATHAGLECGILGALFPGMDMVSIGADIRNCHSPDEAVAIAGVQRLWDLLCAVLERIAVQGGVAPRS